MCISGGSVTRMETRSLGTLQVSEIGMGCMPMNHGYNVAGADPEESRATLHRAVELGITLFDTADVYGPFTNEETVGHFLVNDGYREQVFIATKVGLVFKDSVSYDRNAKPDYIRAACDASLSRLNTDYIDLYQLHRVDPEVPIEESVGAMADLVAAGKVGHIGLSEVTVAELERARSVHPIASVQSELSIWTTDNIDNGVLPYCTTHGIGFLAYSPLGRGFLTGALSAGDIDASDFRSNNPRFTPEALAANQAIVDGIAQIATRHGATPAQVSLAWVLAQGPHVVPIPGTKRRKWLEQNAAAAGLELTEVDLQDIAALPKSAAPRY
jgi:aryl-alcohol dehydrogenase-like predicted oxidoreductase